MLGGLDVFQARTLVQGKVTGKICRLQPQAWRVTDIQSPSNTALIPNPAPAAAATKT
ncbi:MAG: hypothetical protein AAF597_12055 [Bacteroidota bacterium]